MADQDTLSLSCDLTYNNQNCVNVLHFVQQGASGTGTAMDALGVMWTANYKTLYKGLMTVGVNIVQIRVRRLTVVESQSVITAVGEIGTHSGGGMPTHSSALLRQRGASAAARRGTGGQKICGVPRSIVKNGRITEAYATLMQAYGVLGESDITESGSGYKFRQIIISVGGSAGVIVHNSVAPRLVTVRSRQIGVGA